MALATTGDLQDRLGRPLTADEAARAAALLVDASALVENYVAPVTFTEVADDVVELRERRGILHLPARPVSTVSKVELIGCAGMPDITLTGWCFDGIDEVDVRGLRDTVLNLPQVIGEEFTTCTYRVTYTHGYATVPADVVAVVARMVLRTLTSPTMAEGLVSERIGQYAYQFPQFAGGQSAGAGVRLSDDDRMVLNRYRRSATTVLTAIR